MIALVPECSLPHTKCLRAKFVRTAGDASQAEKAIDVPGFPQVAEWMSAFAARFYPRVRRYVEKKTAQRNHALALKALAHKLARACYYVMRDQVPFEPVRLFGS